jgi:hypothetical protein
MKAFMMQCLFLFFTRQSYFTQMSTPGFHTDGLRDICFNRSVDAPFYAAS